MNYYLVGYMYCGKSTFGRRLAAECGMDFLDLDRAFEEKYHYTVPRFFEQFGEQTFRILETQMLHTTAALDNTVISTGGGTPCHSGNMDYILQHGTTIYLKMNVDGLVRRALASRNPRPMMRGLDEEQLHQKIQSQLIEREPIYLRAHLVLDAAAPSIPQQFLISPHLNHK